MKTIAFLAATTLALGGCSSLSSLTPSTTTVAAIATNSAAFLQEVTTITQGACAFVPTAETIASLATSGSISATAADTLANTIANTICAAVTKKSARRGAIASAPKVKGVAIHGHFTNGAMI